MSKRKSSLKGKVSLAEELKAAVEKKGAKDEKEEEPVAPSPLVDALKAAYASGDLTDVTIKVTGKSGSKSFKAHRLILAMHSPLWKKSLYDEKSGAGKSELEVKDVEPALFEQMLSYIYNEKMTGDASDISTLLAAAKAQDVPCVKAYCGSFMTGSMTVENALTLFQNAGDIVGDPKWGLRFISENAEEIIAQDAFLNLPRERLKVLLACDELDIGEGALFARVQAWASAEAKRNKRSGDDAVKDELKDILPLIRFGAMETSDLATLVAPSQLLSGDDMVQLFMYTSLDESARASMSIAYPTKKRECTTGSGEWDPTPSFTHNLYDVSNKGKRCTKARDGSYIYVIREKFKKRPQDWKVSIKCEATGNTDGCDRIGIATERFNYDTAYVHGQDACAFDPSNGLCYTNGSQQSGQNLPRVAVGSIVTIAFSGKNKQVTFTVKQNKSASPVSRTLSWSPSQPDRLYVAICFRNLNWSWSFAGTP